jgi:hypothetical protein
MLTVRAGIPAGGCCCNQALSSLISRLTRLLPLHILFSYIKRLVDSCDLLLEIFSLAVRQIVFGIFNFGDYLN